MKRLLLHPITLSFTLLSILFYSCGQRTKELTPASEYAHYITAYTGGVITPSSSIRIELTTPQPMVQLNSEVKESLFSFKPSLKGKAYWVNNQCIQFIPDEGQLKQGQLYKADFKIGKIQEVSPDLQTFSFSFRVEKQSFIIDLEPCIITEEQPEYATIAGTIRLSNSVSIDKVQQMLTSNYSQIKPTIGVTGDPKSFTILYENIPRHKSEQTFTLEAIGKPVGMEKKETIDVLIPRLGDFYPIAIHALPPSENGVEVVFSEPLLSDQNLKGLIVPSGVGTSYVFQIEDNRVRVYFDRRPSSKVTIDINAGVKSATGMVIADDLSYSVAVASPPPQVKLPFSGTILPDSKNLILPFRAINLSAVDIRIVRVFENNVLGFLQSNNLNTHDELRRFGRLIKKITVRLDQEVDIKLDTWLDFSIDLAPLIEQEPGAIYYIDFTFKQAYSLYPGANPNRVISGVSDSQRGMIAVNDTGLSERDKEYWDEQETYYYRNYHTNWDLYRWDEANDPSKPSFYMSSDRIVHCNVMASNLGVIAKSNADKVWATVSDITTLKPIKDADVVVYNFQLQPIGTASTNSDGFADLELSGKPFVLTAKYQGQTTYLRIVDGEENSLSRFDVGGKEVQRGIKGYIYGERGVWRPGDTLFLTFVLEDKLQRLPASHPVSLEIYQPAGQFYYKEVATSGTNGFYTFSVATKDTDPTGLWSAYIKLGGSTFYKPLRIETIKPNRLKIDLKIPGERIDAYAGTVKAQLSSVWLTGATARNLAAKVEMQLSKASLPFKDYEQFIFNNPASDFSSDQTELFDGHLDEKGDAIFNFVAPDGHSAPGLLRANMVCRVYEPGGDASIFTQSIPFSPFSTYVGINLNQKKDSWMETDVNHQFDIVTLSPSGALKPLQTKLEYKIYKLTWSWWWEHREESFASYIQNRSTTPVESGNVNIINGKGAIHFKVDWPSWGRYLVYVKDPSGGHATGGVVFVDWPSWRGRAQASDPDGITMLAFSTDKASYEVGETVSVSIPASTGGKALVALENGSLVLSRSWVELSTGGDTKYTFKVTPEMAPNFYIHISLLQPHAQTANDLPIRMYGVIPVLVERKDSRLVPKIDMPDVLRPEKPFTVKVSEESGKPMTYTLAVVDDGLLDLTNFKTPDLWSEFYAREALGVKTYDMYQEIVGAFGGKWGTLFGIGGDESLSSSGQKANRFKPVVKFLGPFNLKKGQKGSHNITLPQYVGSVRVMVVAGASGAYGSGAKTVPVRNPLMLLSTLPRVLSVGEEIMLPVNVFAMEDDVKDVQIQVEVSDKLILTGVRSQSIHFASKGDGLCYFKLEVGKSPGMAKVKISATGGGHSATETIEIEVRNPNPVVVTAQERLIPAGGEDTFTFEVDRTSPDSKVTLETSRIPSIDLSRRFDWLENYQHCCTEQLTSKGFPWLFLDKFREVDKELAAMTKTNVTEAIKQIYGRQLLNGGFVYWPDQSSPNDWVTSYAGHFLLKAKEKGYDVNADVLKRWKGYQQKVARSWTPKQNDLEQAYRLYTLALSGSAEKGAMNRLREVTTLSPQAKWRLAATYAIDGQKKVASELIWNVASLSDPNQTRYYSFGSPLRDEAMVLETMVLMNELPSAFAQARMVSQKLCAAYWFDTQSTAFALVAMGALTDKVEKGDIRFDWSIGGEAQKSVLSAKAVYQIDIPNISNRSSGTVTIKNKGGGDLFVRLLVKEQPLVDGTPEISNGIKIDVSYTDMKGIQINPTSLTQGTDLMALVKVSNFSGTNYSDLALTHIIPAGWEVFNERVWQSEDEADSRQLFTYQDIRDDRVFTYFDLPSQRSKTFAIRLQASYSGKYIIPAVSCEAMYDTQVQAKTTAGWVSVVR
ncbi:MAG: alpha-2-macroglobulin [Prevotellaceae bacterium]|jgi:uncharacterized protein YfaS (alpha-2-macroglobulin family)|nr:alpha-2-macroglobulin [Prevotellaceae bacterium]